MMVFFRPQYVVIPERNNVAVSDGTLKIQVQSHSRMPSAQLKSEGRTFRHVHKTEKSDYYCRHAYPSVRHPPPDNSAPNGRIFIKFDTCICFQNLSRKSQFQQTDKKNRYFTWRSVYIEDSILPKSSLRWEWPAQ